MFDAIKEMNKVTLAMGTTGLALFGYAVYRGIKESRATDEVLEAELPEVANPEAATEADA